MLLGVTSLVSQHSADSCVSGSWSRSGRGNGGSDMLVVLGSGLFGMDAQDDRGLVKVLDLGERVCFAILAAFGLVMGVTILVGLKRPGTAKHGRLSELNSLAISV